MSSRCRACAQNHAHTSVSDVIFKQNSFITWHLAEQGCRGESTGGLLQFAPQDPAQTQAANIPRHVKRHHFLAKVSLHVAASSVDVSFVVLVMNTMDRD